MTTPTLLDTEAVAELIGVGAASVRTYLGRSNSNRRNGTPKPGDFPEPDQYFGKRPVWKKATIIKWKQRRPGRGAGGGRPRKAVA